MVGVIYSDSLLCGNTLTLLQYADIDSESEMLGYGIGVILLNIGMYFVAPAILIMKIRKRI